MTVVCKHHHDPNIYFSLLIWCWFFLMWGSEMQIWTMGNEIWIHSKIQTIFTFQSGEEGLRNTCIFCLETHSCLSGLFIPLHKFATFTSSAQRASIRAASCSIFYSRASTSIPSCSYYDSTNQLFPLNVPGAILWCGTDEHSSRNLIPMNWAKTRNKEETFGGGKGIPQPTTFHSLKNFHRVSQAENRVL